MPITKQEPRLFFYSLPDTPIPSAYFLTLQELFTHLANKHSARQVAAARFWTGSHEAPIPLLDAGDEDEDNEI